MIPVRKRLITPPEPAVTVDEAKANSRVPDDIEDALILGFIRSAGAYAETYCGRAFGPQTWEVVLDGFPATDIDLPVGPVASVTSITYLDPAGVSTPLLASGAWELEEFSDPGTIRRLGSWPVTCTSRSAVLVRYVAGLGWPEEVRDAVLLMVGQRINQREATTADPMHEIPFGARAFLDLHRRLYA